ncbi:histidine phosphatase family protein [Citricoccus sp. NPDC055426]|uniref:histidine phosphatase family protein n=1 Tax=Citricoccus sp. NPDC055426 TaxID=3155536 RepID=UPI0034186575
MTGAGRTLYLVRHGEADALGQLTETGREQSRLIGRRLARVPLDAVWHSPLPRAAASASILAGELGAQPPRVLVDAAPELVDHVPHVPTPEELSPSGTGFFDGYGRAEAQAGRRSAEVLVERFGRANARHQRPTHEVLVTHAYPSAWLVREALGAPPARWLSLAGIANAALTVIEHHAGEPSGVVMLNDLSHLPEQLRWTGFAGGRRP